MLATHEIPTRGAWIATIVTIVAIMSIAFPLLRADRAQASPTTLGRTPWQQMITPYPVVSITLSNPAPIHGDTRYYIVAPSVPAENDTRWTPALDPNTVNFHQLSRVNPSLCLQQADFSFLQTIVTIPVGTTISTFTISFSDTDDGARVTIFNSTYPSGLVVPTSYVFLGGNQTADLSGYAATGSNRLVVTQVDDCYSGNNLGYAAVVLNGQVVPPAPTPTPVPGATGWGLAALAIGLVAVVAVRRGRAPFRGKGSGNAPRGMMTELLYRPRWR